MANGINRRFFTSSLCMESEPVVVGALPCAAVREREPELSERCDYCRRSAEFKCADCSLDVCEHHGRYSRGSKVLCTLCRRRAEPRCLECNKAARFKCSSCPQQLCGACSVFCETIHTECAQTVQCRDCAKVSLKRCDVCKSHVCQTAQFHCQHCNVSVASCMSCTATAAHRCDSCAQISCSRCIGPRCAVCIARRCIRCYPPLLLPRCMAPGCLQPVCSVCTIVCKTCDADTCADHSPVSPDRCPACIFGN